MNENDRAESVFAAAVALPAAERAAYLDRACAADPELRRRAEALLRAHDQREHFLDRPAAPWGTVDHTPDGVAGTVIAGRYKLLEMIGEGGMGTVWRAEQREPVKRLVALKLIKPGMDSGAVLARFEAERQALALMDHPHIAKVLDGGTTENGHPYFVMELVKGLPLTDYCDDCRLSVQERLNLFVHICSAVQHAHQKGIIHRDLKPSNILVTEHDGKPVPKVIDFGLAKALGATALTERTLHTAYGTVVGTPLYMAPEQVGINALDVDTRTDIYALGAILYELLTGTTPLEKRRFKEAAWDEIKRLIREEEPPRPSLRLSSSDALPTLAARRQTEPAKLSRLVKGDLDWIVLKALEKDRNRRYETANGLSMDVQRHLSGEPVLAAPPSVTYRLRKFLRKRRGPVLAAALMLLALVSGISGTSWGLVEAVKQRDAADDARAAEAGQRQLAEANATKAVAAAKEETRQRHIADAHAKKAAEAAEQERKAKEREAEQRQAAVAAQRRAMEALQATTDDVMEQLLGARPILGPTEKAFLQATLKRWQVFAAEKGDSPEARAIRAEGLFRVALLRRKLGEQEPAQAEYWQATTLLEQLLAEFPTNPDYRRDLALCYHNLGNVLRDLNKARESEKYFRQALALQAKLVAEFPGVLGHRRALANTHYNLSLLLQNLGQRAEAEEQLALALGLRERLVAEFPAVAAYRHDLAANHNNLAALLQTLDKRTEAEEQYRQALRLQAKLAADFPDVPIYRQDLGFTHNNLGFLLLGLGQPVEAEEHYRQALELLEKLTAEFPAFPTYRHGLAGAHNNLATLLQTLGRTAEAAEQHRQALDHQKKLVAEYSDVPAYRLELAGSHANLGRLFELVGKRKEAEQQQRLALGMHEKLVAEFPDVPAYRQALGVCCTNLGNALQAQGKYADAVVQYRRGQSLQKKLVADFPAIPRYREDLSISHNNLATVHRLLGKLEEAEEYHRQALALREELVAEFPDVLGYRQHLAYTHSKLGYLLADQGKREAEEHYRKALALQQKLVAVVPAIPAYRQELATTHNFWGIWLAEHGKTAEAEEHYRQALDLRQKLAAEFPSVKGYQIDLGGILVNFGNLVRYGQGKPADSLDWFAKAIPILAGVVKSDPGDATARQFLRNGYWGRARALDALGRYEESVKDWHQAVVFSSQAQQGTLRLGRALAQVRLGQVAPAVAEVAALAKYGKATPGAVYNFACVYALASAKDKDKKEEYAKRAVELLQRAVKEGFNNVEQFQKDADLDSLRGREDFQRLIESIAKSKDPAPK
jgi:serine/threonine protein kinase/tetratricopeptide (TPR) repeat protein